MSRCALWMCVAVLGITACGGTEVDEPVAEPDGEVQSMYYYAHCQVDAHGYQTGYCIDMNYYEYCRAYRSEGCDPNVPSPVSTNFNACGTRVNDNWCNDKYRLQVE